MIKNIFINFIHFLFQVMYERNMVAECFPLGKRQPDANTDVLSGADFLSILMNSSTKRKPIETTSNPTTTTVIEIDNYVVNVSPQIRMRSTRSSSPFAQSTTEHLVISDRISDSSDRSNEGVILAVRISSSVGKTLKKVFQPVTNFFDETTDSEATTVIPTTDIGVITFAAEELPSIVAKSSKSELSVEESEPITHDHLSSIDYEESYPAKVEPLPGQSHSSYDPTADFLNQEISKSTKQPIHHTVIYHAPTEDAKGARSISYSSIIQALPSITVETDKPVQHERHERNYHGAQVSYVNNFSDNIERRKNDTRISNVQSENRNNFLPRSSTVTETWKNSLKSQDSQLTTERNWESQEKPYVSSTQKPSQLPKIYGRAEQNFEVDEAVSVETNGRAHGIQPSLPPRSEKKHDDNQKVGYVVEGRNYRKYRVEERTADGFIVGEYGVVSHDDGSLRGVRYTADGTINPRVISEALMKFLSL